MNRQKENESNKTKGCLYTIAIIFALMVIGVIAGWFDDPAPKPTPAAKTQSTLPDTLKKQFSAWDGSHHKTVRYVKGIMKNPKSFEHVKTTYTPHKDKNYRVIMMQYRGTNSFNAVVTNTIFVQVKLNGDVVKVISQL